MGRGSSSSGSLLAGIEEELGILEHSLGFSFRTLISMIEIFPRFKFQGTGTLWMVESVVFGSRYLAKGKHRTETQQALSFTLNT